MLFSLFCFLGCLCFSFYAAFTCIHSSLSSSARCYFLFTLPFNIFVLMDLRPFSVILISLFSFLVSLPLCWFAIGCVWCHVCSGRLSLVSGFGLCPPRPSSPWQAAQEHFLGRYRSPPVCPLSPGPENTWCSVFLLTCTTQCSSSINCVRLYHQVAFVEEHNASQSSKYILFLHFWRRRCNKRLVSLA